MNTDVEPKSQYSIEEHPSSLDNKIGLMLQFRKSLKMEEAAKTDEGCSENPIHLKKWMKTTHAYMFKMSNKTFQIVFTDLTRVIIFSLGKKLYYLNKKNEGVMYDLKDALESKQPELSKRIRYAKDILMQTFSNSKVKM